MHTEEINIEQISKQLSLILSSDLFQNSTVLYRLLKFIVEERLSGREKELKEYTIAVNVLMKRSDFNPQTDPIVRIHAGRLRRAILEYYREVGKNDPVIISIPKGAYIPVFSLKNISTESVAIATKQESGPSKRITVAVLPFSNISNDSSAVAFADGLGDHLCTTLTQFAELSVISYYSCRNIINKTTDIKEISLMLDAKYIVTGTVQINKQTIRIRVQLILGETREQVWAKTYDRENTALDLFSIQDEIVHHIVSQTAGGYGAIIRNLSKTIPQKNFEDLQLYNAIFWYYHFVNDISEEMFVKAEAIIQKAIEADPDYALGWAILGEVFVGGYFMGLKSRLTENQLEQAVIYGKKAKKLDANCQHAYQTIALSNIFLHNKADALKAIEEWTNIKPSESGIMGAMGCCLIFCGEYEKGYKMLDDSVQLNPYYQWWFNAAFSFYYFQKDLFEDALYWAEKILMPDLPWEYLLKAASLAQMGCNVEAKQYTTQINHRFPFIQNMLEQYVGAFLQDELLVNKLYDALIKAGIKD